MAPDQRRTYGQQEFLSVAVSRLLAGPLFLAFIAIDAVPTSTALWLVVGASVVYTFVIFGLAASPRWDAVDARWLIVSDMIVLGSVMLVSGGPLSYVIVIMYVLPIAMSILHSPRVVLVTLAGMMLTFFLGSLPFLIGDPLSFDDDEFRNFVIGELALAWIGSTSLSAAYIFRSRAANIERLSVGRQRLLADALSAEDRARRRLSQSLHDDTLQVLLAAGQDLDGGMRGDRPQLERAREELRLAVRKLRETVRGLHPAALEHGGLSGGIDTTVEMAAVHGGFSTDVRIDPAAGGVNDALVMSLVRELVTNAAKHAEAGRVGVQVTRGIRELVLEVSDDGRGFPPGRPEMALAEGHIGLASCAERVEAAGGRFELSSQADVGTSVRVRIPAPPIGSGQGAGDAAANGVGSGEDEAADVRQAGQARVAGGG